MTKTTTSNSERCTQGEIVVHSGPMETGEPALHQQGLEPQSCSDGSEKQNRSTAATLESSQKGGDSESILDVSDVADLFHCSREKIKRMARSGELPAFKFGKRWYVLRHDLERFLSDKVESSRHLRRIQEVSP